MIVFGCVAHSQIMSLSINEHKQRSVCFGPGHYSPPTAWQCDLMSVTERTSGTGNKPHRSYCHCVQKTKLKNEIHWNHIHDFTMWKSLMFACDAYIFILHKWKVIVKWNISTIPNYIHTSIIVSEQKCLKMTVTLLQCVTAGHFEQGINQHKQFLWARPLVNGSSW